MKFIYTAFLTILISCTTNKKSNVEIINNDQPKTIVDKTIHQYIVLKDAFIKEDVKSIDSAASLFIAYLNSCNATEISDTSLLETAYNCRNTSNNIIKNLIASNNIIEKRNQFKELTHPMQNLLKKYNYTTLYLQQCPMAKEYSKDEKVYWISNSDKIANPFFPKTMLRCGLLIDTLQKTK